ncbi:hypothetical protein EJB05_02126 [Eragrostis curvula]|uniref:Uncharacterized protein n=1 Tax=Eragrostis curvula TaxID=38414 RepID=A0A5J9WRG3_9POAL|nr:hypothetical protein EJB05_02126 [Eragrostis curvula]
MTTAPCPGSASAPDVYYWFPKGFPNISLETTRNANAPSTAADQPHQDPIIRSHFQVNLSPDPHVSIMFHNIAHILVETLFQIPACDHKDWSVERQPKTTAQSTGLIMVDLVKYYANFPVLPALWKEGERGDGGVLVAKAQEGASEGRVTSAAVEPYRGCWQAGKRFERPCVDLLASHLW